MKINATIVIVLPVHQSGYHFRLEASSTRKGACGAGARRVCARASNGASSSTAGWISRPQTAREHFNEGTGGPRSQQTRPIAGYLNHVPIAAQKNRWHRIDDSSLPSRKERERGELEDARRRWHSQRMMRCGILGCARGEQRGVACTQLRAPPPLATKSPSQVSADTHTRESRNRGGQDHFSSNPPGKLSSDETSEEVDSANGITAPRIPGFNDE